MIVPHPSGAPLMPQNPSSKKIVSKEEYPGLTEGTSVQNVFAIGDVLDVPPLPPCMALTASGAA